MDGLPLDKGLLLVVCRKACHRNTKESTMNEQEIAAMQERLRELHAELATLGPVMRGSVVNIGTKTKQYYFSLSKDKKTVLLFLGKKRVDRAREYSANYKRLLDIVEEMTIINMKLLKAKVGL
jgi:ADP-heptose:LPS heptosyltransferase